MHPILAESSAMQSWLPALPYPPPDQPGYWQPHSATLQWCEEDYYATYYIAEIINTLTNFLFIYLSIKGVRSCLRHGHDTVFLIAYIGYFLVGFGSFLFHATLQYPWQLVDELNMIYTTCLMAYGSLSFDRSKRTQVLLAVSLTALCLGITVYYHHIQDPTFHQRVYAAMTIFIVFRSAYSMETSLRPYFRRKHSQTHSHTADEARDLATLKRMYGLIAYGLSIFLGGFAIWTLDNVYCSTLRRWRRQIGLPWGLVLEGHGWWHLMTGIGAYCYIVWGIHIRHVLRGQQGRFVMVWEGWFSLPEIVKVDDEKVERRNGAVKHTEEANAAAVTNGAAVANGRAGSNGSVVSNGHVKKRR